MPKIVFKMLTNIYVQLKDNKDINFVIDLRKMRNNCIQNIQADDSLVESKGETTP